MEKPKNTMRSAEEQADLRELDAIIENMRKYTPDTPFMMDTPSDRPYKLAEAEMDNWRINTPFEADERHLQYMTFLWRDPNTTLFKLDRIPEDPPAKPSPPKNNGPVKKIKFDAYKNRAKLQAQGATPAGQVSSGLKVEEAKPTGKTTELPKAEAQASDGPQVSESKAHAEEYKSYDSSIKRDVDSTPSSSLDNKETMNSANVHSISLARETAKEENTTKHYDAAQCPPVEKPISDSVNSENIVEESSTEVVSPAPSVPHQSAKVMVEKGHELPPWTSIPFSSSVEFSMPSRLPTPPTESTIDSSLSKKPSSPNGEPQAWVPSTLNQTEEPAMDKIGNSSALQAMKRKPAQNLEALLDQDKVVVSTPTGKKLASMSSDATKSDVLDSTTKKEKFVVKLKFSRTRMKTVSSILRLKPNSSSSNVLTGKNAAPAVKQPDVGNGVRKALPSTVQKAGIPNVPVVGNSMARKTVTPSKTPSTTPRVPNREDDDVKESPSNRLEKRMRSTEEGVPEHTPKRTKLSEYVTNSRSKAPAALKNDANTPRRDLKAVNGIGAKTTTNSSTPKPTSENQKRSANVGAEAVRKARSPESWAAEVSRLSDLGRTLKHEAVHTLKSVDRANAIREPEEACFYIKLNMLQRTESALCFMLAFSAASYTKTPPKGLIGNWRSLIPMASENLAYCRPFGDIGGLCALLVAVCHSKIPEIYGELKGSNIGSGDENRHLKLIIQDLEGAQKHGAEVERLLPRAVLAKRYRETNKFYETLPMGMNMKPVTAVKLALSFMKEWAANEDVQWKTQLEQDVLQFDA